MDMIGSPRRRVLAVYLACFVILSASAASPPSLSVRDYRHTSWTESAGQPLPTMQAMAQTATGYLWLVTAGGHLRFDGLRFSEWPLEPRSQLPQGAHRIAVAVDGSIWLTDGQVLTRVRGGAVDSYRLPLRVRHVDALIEGSSGSMWLLSTDEQHTITWMLEPQTRAWRQLGISDGLPSGRLHVLARQGGVFWVGGDGCICRWLPGTPAACRQVSGSVLSVVATRAGVFAATSTAVYRVSPTSVEPLLANTGILPGRLVLDRAGKLWIGTNHGLLVFNRGSVETYAREDGLSGEYIYAIVEDTEGDIWVATNVGVDRFRPPRALHVTRLDGMSNETVSAIQATRDGSIWVGALNSGLNRIIDGKIVHYSAAEGLPGRPVMALHEDATGRLWAGAGREVLYFENGRFHSVFADPRLEPISTLASDGNTMWVASRALWRISDSAGQPLQSGLPQDILRVFAAPGGPLWVGSFNTGLLTFTRGAASAAPVRGVGAGVGAVRDILRDSAGNLWVAFGPTLNRIRRGRVTTWSAAQGLDAGEIAGLALDPTGNLWIAGEKAAARVSLADLARSPDGQPLSASFFSVYPQDGFRPVAKPGIGSPRITVAPDGRVWLCERDGVGILDPQLLGVDSVPPPVVIEDAVIDGTPLRGSAVEFRGRQLQITYAGNSLMAPDRVRFRYRLEPGDSDWTDAGGRREMTFVGLPPGNYRFRVAACNLDGVCNERGAALAFRVMPFFYQTIWFRLGIFGALGAVAFGIYKLRMRQLVNRYHLVAQERARVTREIHDSLLQGFTGVVFQLDAASRQFETNPVASKERLDRALDQADNSLREARQMLLDMRLPILEDKTVSEALNEVGANATRGTSIAFHLRSRGVERDLPYPAQAALFLIGREAITNAVNHANPNSIAVHVTVDEKSVRHLVQDDGVGFDLEAARRKAGHLGVTGMGERARHAGAHFQIDTAPGAGARVEVVVPRNRTER
jgi:signal transduction histidine kinase/ligand-binding sensor domain-containing protein